MTTTVNLRKILDRKQHEFISPAPIASAAGFNVIGTPPNWYRQMALYNAGTSSQYLYDLNEDAFELLPAGTLGAPTSGTCGCFHPYGPTFTASAGSATAVTSNLTVPGDLTGATMRCTAGTGAGSVVTIPRTPRAPMPSSRSLRTLPPSTPPQSSSF